jgi:hypothetical protein
MGATQLDHPFAPMIVTTVGSPTTLIGPLETCGTEKVVRHFNNGLYTVTEEDTEFIVPRYQDTPLSIDTEEARLLTLHPADNIADHVRCDMRTYSLMDLPSFVAIQDARGYRHIPEAIEINGGALLISFALERFLRYLRTKIDKPTLLWVRYICVLEFDPDEQKTYWTREFSDRMYSLATEAIDMHKINNRLIENGYFERMGYGAWNKEWYRSKQELVLPRVCPIRLGTKADIENPTMDYRYMPLDMFANEIRIICIMPAKDFTAPIIAHAAHCPIKCEVTYIALSCKTYHVTLHEIIH